MSHRISLEEARIKIAHEKECQDLNEKGIQPKISRREKKRKLRMSKAEKFTQMLKDRGGYFKLKKEEKND